MSSGAKIYWRIGKAVVAAIVVALSFAFMPDAIAHGAVPVASRDSNSEEGQLQHAQSAVHAVDEAATSYFLVAAAHSAANLNTSGAPASEAAPCHDSCCCGVIMSCASCSGAAISPEICANLFLLTMELSLPAERVPLGLPSIPADPPPRALL